MDYKFTVGDFAAALEGYLREYRGDEIESVVKSDDGYTMTVKRRDTIAELQIDTAHVKVSATDEIDEEISLYSIMTNVFYVTQMADRLLGSKQIPNVPRVELMTLVVQLAEQFEREHGGDADGQDPIVKLENFAENELKTRLAKI